MQDMLKLWLSPICNPIVQMINSNDPSIRVSGDEFVIFIRVHCFLVWYGCTPTVYFDPDHAAEYPSASSIGMSLKRFSQILAALGKNSRVNNAVDDDNNAHRTWETPLEPDGAIANLFNTVRQVCSGIGFVKGASVVSFDDDHLRQRSKKCEDAGLVRHRNPKKGFGPVHHAMTSLLTGMYLAGHVTARGESGLDAIHICIQSLGGTQLFRNVSLDNWFACDRGYQTRSAVDSVIGAGQLVALLNMMLWNVDVVCGLQDCI